MIAQRKSYDNPEMISDLTSRSRLAWNRRSEKREIRIAKICKKSRDCEKNSVAALVNN